MSSKASRILKACGLEQPRKDAESFYMQDHRHEFPSLLRSHANWLPWVQHVVRVPYGGLPHVLQDGLAQRHYL